jgi:menaquinone-dependent protoporphyrinogen oxidase
VCEIPVFYATTEGQTRRIAKRLAQILEDRGFDSRAIDVGSPEAWCVDWSHVRGAILGASLHGGTHQPAALAFARTHARELHACPSIFFSVSLLAASKHPHERAATRRRAEEFLALAHWQPRSIHCIAGRLAYTRYGFLKRLVLQMIAKREVGSTDTSRDHEYTDWYAVEQLAREMADVVRYDAQLLPLGA